MKSSIQLLNTNKNGSLLLGLFIFALATVAEARNPQVSSWMKNLSSTSSLEPPAGVVWQDEFSDLNVSGNTVHTLWYSRKNDWSDYRFVYRRSTTTGNSWEKEQILVSKLASGAELVADSSAKYLCVAGNSVHIVVPVSYPISSQRSWYYRLYYYRSTNGGKSFDAPKVLVEGADVWHITQPHVACNTQRVVIGYKYRANWYDNYQIPLLISDNGGGKFRAVTPVANNEDDGNFEDLLLVGKDIYILHYWLLEPYYFGNFQAKIGLSSSIDDGHSFRNRWLSTQAKDKRFYALGTKDSYNSPDIAVVGSNVHVIWNQLDTNYQGVKTLMYRRSTDKGDTFSAPVKFYTGAVLSPGQETIAAQGNYAYVLFPTTDNKIHLRRSANQGATFNADSVISTEGGWWPEIAIDPRNANGASFYTFWDSPTYRYSNDGGASFNEPLWLYQAFTTGSYQRSHTKVSTTGLLHSVTSASYYSGSLCGGYCDRDVFYRRTAPNPVSSVIGKGLRLYTSSQSFEDRADNMQVLAKTLNFSKQLTAEVWIKDLGGGIGTGFSDYRTPILFKQRDLKTGYNPGFSLGTIDYFGKRGLIAQLQTTQGLFEVRGQNKGLLDNKTWTHLSMTYNAGLGANNFKLYKNGNLVSTATLKGNIDAGIGNFIVGRYGNWVVDEVRLWNRTLSQAEIKTNMAHTLTGKEVNLQAYFPFKDSALDVTGHGNNGLFMYHEQYVAGKY